MHILFYYYPHFIELFTRRSEEVTTNGVQTDLQFFKIRSVLAVTYERGVEKVTVNFLFLFMFPIKRRHPGK